MARCTFCGAFTHKAMIGPHHHKQDIMFNSGFVAKVFLFNFVQVYNFVQPLVITFNKRR